MIHDSLKIGETATTEANLVIGGTLGYSFRIKIDNATLSNSGYNLVDTSMGILLKLPKAENVANRLYTIKRKWEPMI